ncbi:hypothetical protein Zmor_024566 [Zophobas morio]|uniref:Uncharacterized protein n=1 Tax=Zophobas morio TaxID=2755281 RepID=A0AA38M7V5_9CUCU|nr:hypothetical protein Zmor_024566 [Zophobas morio]
MWGLIWRICKDLSPLSLKTLYCPLVRSKLEYFSPVWTPIYKVDLEMLEKIQKRFLRMIEFKVGHRHIIGDYSWVMYTFNIPPLSVRRRVYDACVLYGLINGRIDNPHLLSELSFIVPVSNSRLTRSRIIFRVTPALTNIAKNHPRRRMMLAANDLAGRREISIFDSTLSSFRHNVLLFYNNYS